MVLLLSEIEVDASMLESAGQIQGLAIMEQRERDGCICYGDGNERRFEDSMDSADGEASPIIPLFRNRQPPLPSE